MTTTRVELRNLGKALDAVHRQLVEPLGISLTEETAVTAFNFVVRHSPVGTTKNSRHPGKYRASNTLSRGARPLVKALPDAATYPIPGEPEARLAMRGLKLGQAVHLVNHATSDGAKESYAKFLEPPYTKSPQAPQGNYALLRKWLPTQAPRISDRAFRRLQGGL